MTGIESLETIEFLKLVVAISAGVGASVAGALRSGEALIGKRRFYKQEEIAHFTDEDRKKLVKIKDTTHNIYEVQDRSEWKKNQEREHLKEVERELREKLNTIERRIKDLA